MWIWPVTLADEGAPPLFKMRDLGVDAASLNIGIYTPYRSLLPQNARRPIYNMEEAGANGIWFFSYDLANAEVL